MANSKISTYDLYFEQVDEVSGTKIIGSLTKNPGDSAYTYTIKKYLTKTDGVLVENTLVSSVEGSIDEESLCIIHEFFGILRKL